MSAIDTSPRQLGAIIMQPSISFSAYGTTKANKHTSQADAARTDSKVQLLD
jgi:hypothetical protein